MNDDMNMDADQIDHIVREVMRRLLSMNGPVEARHASPPIAVARTSPATNAAVRANTTAETTTDASQTLCLSDRIVTMASVSGRLVGINRVRVSSGAIVTPLVIDALREHGVQLDRQRSSSAVAAPNDRTLRLAADAVQTRRVATLLDEIAPHWHSLPTGDDLLSQIASTAPNRRTIVLTTDWASVVCRANRHRQLRASVASSALMVEQACQQTDINVLVIDSSRLTDPELHDLIRQYVDHVQHANRSASTEHRPTNAQRIGRQQ